MLYNDYTNAIIYSISFLPITIIRVLDPKQRGSSNPPKKLKEICTPTFARNNYL